MARSALANRCAARSMASGGTPVFSAAVRGSQARTDSATCSNPVVYAEIKSRSFQTVAQNDVQQSHVQSQVRAGPHGKIHVGIAADRRHARIDDDEFSAAIAAAPQIVRRDRRALGDIRARHENDLRFENVRPGQRAAVDAERQLVGGARRDHAKPSVVVDVPRAERDAREFSEQIGLLGNQRRAAVNGHGILAVFLLYFSQARYA